MISELFDMFNRTHTGNSDDDRKDFVIIVKIILSSLGSDLYTYMRMLEVTKRKEEAELIKQYRDDIFKCRDNYDNGIRIKEDEIAQELRRVATQINVHVTMLRSSDDRKWEAQLFQSVQNDLPNMAFHMENIRSMKIPQRVN